MASTRPRTASPASIGNVSNQLRRNCVRTSRGTVRHDIYERILAVCGAGNVNANDWLVRQGFASSYRKMKAYRAAEAEARAAGRGIWRGENLQPWEWSKQGN